MSNDIRDYPARARSSDGLYRFLGGSPLSVAFRLVLLSILVGVVLSAIGFDPLNALQQVSRPAVEVMAGEDESGAGRNEPLDRLSQE